jgi:hypothetical protein
MGEEDQGVDGVSGGRTREALRQAFDALIDQIAFHYSEDLERCWTILLDVTGRRERYAKLDSWMEKRLLKAPWLSPTRLASEARYYCKMPGEMRPFLLVLARRVKTRVRVRVFRERLAADIELGQSDMQEVPE